MRRRFLPAFLAFILASALAVLAPGPNAAEASILDWNKPPDLAIFQREIATLTDVNVADERGVTPLMFATRYLAFREMQSLLDRGADPNARSRYGFTAFNFAVTDRAKAELLIE